MGRLMVGQRVTRIGEEGWAGEVVEVLEGSGGGRVRVRWIQRPGRAREFTVERADFLRALLADPATGGSAGGS